MRQPFAPGGLAGQASQRLDHLQRDLARMIEVEQLTIEHRDAPVFLFKLGAFAHDLFAQPVQPPLPSLAAVDYRGLDNQLLPSPRRPHRAFHHRNRVADKSGRLRGWLGNFEFGAQTRRR